MRIARTTSMAITAAAMCLGLGCTDGDRAASTYHPPTTYEEWQSSMPPRAATSESTDNPAAYGGGPQAADQATTEAEADGGKTHGSSGAGTP